VGGIVPVIEIDGNMVSNGGYDWFTGIGQSHRLSDNTCDIGDLSFGLICDSVENDIDTFYSGAVEQNPSSFVPVKTSLLLPKDDITTVYSLFTQDSNLKIALYIAMEKLPQAGELHLDFEYNNQITKGYPDRKVGDLLVAFDIVKGNEFDITFMT